MKDILNTYSVKELKQFISKYNKSLGSVKRYSILKKGELVELMSKKENVSKFKSIKAKAKPPAPKKIDSVSKKNRNAPKPKPKEKEQKPKSVNTKMPKFNIISKEELEKRKEKREEQKTKPKKKFDVEEIEEKLRKEIDNVYQDIIEMFIDGRGSEEKQLMRASERAAIYIRKRTRQYAKKEKIKTTKDFIKKIKENIDSYPKSNFRDWLDL